MMFGLSVLTMIGLSSLVLSVLLSALFGFPFFFCWPVFYRYSGNGEAAKLASSISVSGRSCPMGKSLT